ncbi:MAG: EAL domain-containing protein [Nitrosomonas sp.]|nr:MAG: EAL domain-containing protein [Nitrosomonas sp.]
MNASIKYSHTMNEFELIQSATDYAFQRDSNGWISGRFYRCELTSTFQPVFSVAQQQTMGHSAYIRSKANGEAELWPWQIFSLASKDEQLIELDRLCRAIHALNYHFNRISEAHKLFVEVHPRLLESVKHDHGHAFENFLSLIGVRTSGVVIEIPAAVNHNGNLLQHVITNYRSRGYRIAANCSGNRNDRMEGLGSLYPDIVRISASDLMLQEDTLFLVDTIHSCGGSLLVRDVETPAQLAAALQAKADYLQGNLLGKPGQAINTAQLLPISALTSS